MKKWLKHKDCQGFEKALPFWMASTAFLNFRRISIQVKSSFFTYRQVKPCIQYILNPYSLEAQSGKVESEETQHMQFWSSQAYFNTANLAWNVPDLNCKRLFSPEISRFLKSSLFYSTDINTEKSGPWKQMQKHHVDLKTCTWDHSAHSHST